MVVIRPTASLAKRMRLKLAANNEGSSTVLGDWYALDLVLDRQQYILCVSGNGRLPVLLKAAPYGTFPLRLIETLSKVLQKIGIPKSKIQGEIEVMSSVTLAKTNNRSIIGSMNEFRFQLRHANQLGHFRHDPVEASVELAGMISLVLPDYTPMDTVLKLFGQPKAPRPRRPQLTLVPSKS